MDWFLFALMCLGAILNGASNDSPLLRGVSIFILVECAFNLDTNNLTF